MAEKLDARGTVGIEELLMSNVIEQEALIDGEIVIAGSFNFNRAAGEKNAENLLVIRDKNLAAKYLENWKMNAEHSELYEGRGESEAKEHNLWLPYGWQEQKTCENILRKCFRLWVFLWLMLRLSPGPF